MQKKIKKRRSPRLRDLETTCLHLFEAIVEKDRELMCGLPEERCIDCEYQGIEKEYYITNPVTPDGTTYKCERYNNGKPKTK